jgi:hypothetical protein
MSRRTRGAYARHRRTLHVVGDARQFGIAQRRLPAIAAHGSWRPAINANRCAIRQSLRGSDEQETTPTANVEDALMPTPGDGAQQLVRDTELPAQTIVEHTDRHDQEVQTERQAEPPPKTRRGRPCVQAWGGSASPLDVLYCPCA